MADRLWGFKNLKEQRFFFVLLIFHRTQAWRSDGLDWTIQFQCNGTILKNKTNKKTLQRFAGGLISEMDKTTTTTRRRPELVHEFKQLHTMKSARTAALHLFTTSPPKSKCHVVYSTIPPLMFLCCTLCEVGGGPRFFSWSPALFHQRGATADPRPSWIAQGRLKLLSYLFFFLYSFPKYAVEVFNFTKWSLSPDAYMC